MEGIRKINLAVNLIAAIACGISAIVYMDITLAIMTIIFVIITNNYKTKKLWTKKFKTNQMLIGTRSTLMLLLNATNFSRKSKTQASNNHLNSR